MISSPRQTWAAAILILLALPATAQPDAIAVPTVGDIERRAEVDVIELRNGDTLVGSLELDGLAVQTAMGPVTLGFDQIAGWEPAQIDGAVRVLGRRVTQLVGFVDRGNQPLRMRLSTGGTLELPWHAVRTAALRTAGGEPNRHGNLIQTTSGDIVSGSIDLAQITIATSLGDVVVPLGELQRLWRVQDASHDDWYVAAATKAGTEVYGRPIEPTLSVRLDVGGTLELPVGGIASWVGGVDGDTDLLGGVGNGIGTHGGELTIDDPVEPGRQRYYDEFTFEARAGQRIVVDMTCQSFDNYTMLFSPSGRQWQNDDFGNTRRSRIEQVAPENGTYTARATSLVGQQTGEYEITITVE
jgi:hypothetical protein